VEGGRIVDVGTGATLRGGAGTGEPVLDLGGGFLCPGFVDAHAHVLGLGLSLTRVDLNGASSAAEARERVARAAAALDAAGSREEWIRGWGWDQNDWPGSVFPSRADLDGVSGSHPVALTRVDGHALWVNSRALAAGGITARTPDPPGGRILRDEAGEPTGVLIDEAEEPVRDAMPPLAAAAKRSAILEANDLLVRLGVTGVHDMGMSAEEVGIYRELDREERLAVRITGAVLFTDPRLEEVLSGGPDRDGAGGTFQLTMVKFYTDGALGSRGAALLAPYEDDPENAGLLLMESKELRQGLDRVRRAGFQCAVHAIGDRANRMVLDAWMARGEPEGTPPGLRLEHAQILSPPDIPRVGEMGVLASVQPTHFTSDMPWAQDRLGADRMRGAYAWRSLRVHGARLAIGSDFPIEPPNPLFGLHAAVTRAPRGTASARGWSPEERLGREEALAACTWGPAFASGDLATLGTLTPSKRADFVVLDRNLITCEPDGIPEARVRATVIDGRPVWVDPEAPFAGRLRELL